MRLYEYQVGDWGTRFALTNAAESARRRPPKFKKDTNLGRKKETAKRISIRVFVKNERNSREVSRECLHRVSRVWSRLWRACWRDALRGPGLRRVELSSATAPTHHLHQSRAHSPTRETPCRSALFGRHHGLSYLQQIQASLIGPFFLLLGARSWVRFLKDSCVERRNFSPLDSGGFLSALSTIPLDVAVANLQALGITVSDDPDGNRNAVLRVGDLKTQTS